MEWNESLSVKVSRFDNEHKKLLEIIKVLDDAMSQGEGKDVLSKTLEELLNYTKTHFKNEEQLMQQHGYSGYSNQKVQHDAFIKKVTDLHEDYEKGNTMLSVSVMVFLKNWVITHIQKVDAEYASFFNGKGVK